jgi:hypothetical protein
VIQNLSDFLVTAFWYVFMLRVEEKSSNYGEQRWIYLLKSRSQPARDGGRVLLEEGLRVRKITLFCKTVRVIRLLRRLRNWTDYFLGIMFCVSLGIKVRELATVCLPWQEWKETSVWFHDVYYLEVLKRLHEKVTWKRPELFVNNSWTMHLLTRHCKQITVLEHSPYSPDLAPVTFFCSRR